MTCKRGWREVWGGNKGEMKRKQEMAKILKSTYKIINYRDNQWHCGSNYEFRNYNSLVSLDDFFSPMTLKYLKVE